MDMKIGLQARADQRGFTLTELLVAIAILGLIMLGVMTLLISGNESYLTGSNQAEAQASVRAALERITQDIRETGYDPQGRQACDPALGPPAGCFDAVVNSGAPTNRATLPTGTVFMLQSDWNGTGPVAPAIPIEPGLQVPVTYSFGIVNRGERITYDVVGGNLRRQETVVDAQPQILVTSVQQAATGQNCLGAQIANPPFFQYCDANGNPAVTTDQIKTVVVNLRVGVQNQPPAIWMAGAVTVTMSDRIRLRNRI
jgi:prepilin-type N-terminal cleavage/methylation domain-containing protein